MVCPECAVHTSGKELYYVLDEMKTRIKRISEGKLVLTMSWEGEENIIERFWKGACRNNACSCKEVLLFWKPSEDQSAILRLGQMGITVIGPEKKRPVEPNSRRNESVADEDAADPFLSQLAELLLSLFRDHTIKHSSGWEGTPFKEAMLKAIHKVQDAFTAGIQSIAREAAQTLSDGQYRSLNISTHRSGVYLQVSYIPLPANEVRHYFLGFHPEGYKRFVYEQMQQAVNNPYHLDATIFAHVVISVVMVAGRCKCTVWFSASPLGMNNIDHCPRVSEPDLM